jgi:hypothetical protein
MITTGMNLFNLESSFHNYQANDSVFMDWLKLVEDEQSSRGILKNTVINRQLLHYLWENGYSPIEALKDLNCDELSEHH